MAAGPLRPTLIRDPARRRDSARQAGPDPLSGDQPAPGTHVRHPDEGVLVVVRTVTTDWDYEPLVHTIAARCSTLGHDAEPKDEDEGGWLDAEYVEALIEQAGRQREYE